MIRLHTNPDILRTQLARYKQLNEAERDKVDAVAWSADLDKLALEGLEVRNDLNVPVSINLYLSETSNTFYLDISKPNPDGLIVEKCDHDWIQVEVKKIA